MKKIWNNRKFRTFIQTFIATLLTSLGAIAFTDIDINIWFNIVIIALATGLSKIMPVVDEEEED